MTNCQRDRSEHLCRSLVSVVCCGALLVSGSWAQQTDQTAATQKNEIVASLKEPGPRERREAEKAYLDGAKLLDRGDIAGAEDRFRKATQLNPEDSTYLRASEMVHERRVTDLVQRSGQARMLGKLEESQKLLAEAQQLGSGNPLVTQHAETTSTVQPRVEFSLGEDSSWRSPMTIAGPIALRTNVTKQNFKVTASSRQVIQQVLQRYGIQASFDESVENKMLRFDLENVTFGQATKVLFSMADVFMVPIDATRVLIAKDTVDNRDRLEHQMEETIYLPAMTTAEMNELGTVVRSVFDIRQASVQTTLGSIALRAPEDTLNAVNLTLADLIDGNAEVTLDIRLYMVDLTRQRNIGAQLPQQIGVYNVASEARNIVSANQDLVNQAISQGLVPADASDVTIALALISSGLVSSSLLSNTLGFFGGGLTTTGITTNAATTFNLALNSSNTRTLDSIILRLTDRQAGTFRSGSRYPIITGTYTNAVASNTSSLAGTTINGVSASSLLNQFLGSSSSVTIPQIQYEDLGLTLKATPVVQRSGMVKVGLDLKLEALGGTSINNIPILVNRQYASDITVKDGETTLLASTLSRSESAAVSGIPGLSQLPGFQTATADKVTETDSSELVMLITPHVVRHRVNDSVGPRIAYSKRLPN